MAAPDYEHLRDILSSVLQGGRPQGPFSLEDGTGLHVNILYLPMPDKDTLCVPYFYANVEGALQSLRSEIGASFNLKDASSSQDLLYLVLRTLPSAQRQALAMFKEYKAGLADQRSCCADTAIKTLEGILPKDTGFDENEEFNKALAVIQNPANLPHTIPMGFGLVVQIRPSSSASYALCLSLRHTAANESIFLGAMSEGLSSEGKAMELARYMGVAKDAAKSWAESMKREADNARSEAAVRTRRADRLLRAAKDTMDYATYWDKRDD